MEYFLFTQESALLRAFDSLVTLRDFMEDKAAQKELFLSSCRVIRGEEIEFDYEITSVKIQFLE